MFVPYGLKSPLAGALIAGLLLVLSPIEAVQNVYVKTYTPLLSSPSERTGKPLKNLALNEVVTVVYTEEALGVTDLAQTWVRVRAAPNRNAPEQGMLIRNAEVNVLEY